MKEGASDEQRERHAEITRESLTYLFNQSLCVLDSTLTPVSHDTILRWLKSFFPRHSVSPLQSDYCDTCAELKRRIDSIWRANQHLLDSGSAAVSDILAKDQLIDSYNANLRHHRNMATKQQEECKERITRTAEYFRRNILGRELNSDREEAANHCLSNENDAEVVLACDFQMGKLVFGIVDSSNSRKHVYVTDETMAGDKASDHVCSFLFENVERIVQPRARFLRLYFDAAPYFKTKYMVWCAAEMVARGRFCRVTMSYIVPGHTKFEPDSLFAQIVNRFYKTDVFETNELLHVIGACNAVPQWMALRGLRRWKTSLAEKYVDVPRITEWNTMVVEKEAANGITTGVTLKVKHSVTHGDYMRAFRRNSIALHLVKNGVAVEKDAVPGDDMSSACNRSMRKPLFVDKLRNITEMYESYVPRDRWPIQLTEALQLHRTEVHDNRMSELEEIHQVGDGQQEEKAIRVGALIGGPKGAARAHTYLRRVDGSIEMSGEALAETLRKAPNSGIRTMPRRKRARRGTS